MQNNLNVHQSEIFFIWPDDWDQNTFPFCIYLLQCSNAPLLLESNDVSVIHSATGLRGDFVHVLSGPLKDASAKQTIGEDVHVA